MAHKTQGHFPEVRVWGLEDKYIKLSVLRSTDTKVLYQGPDLTEFLITSEEKDQFEEETDQDQGGDDYLPSEVISPLQTKMKATDMQE